METRNPLRGLVMLALSLLAPTVHAQTVLGRFLPPSGVTIYTACSGLGDVNGDGAADIGIGGPGYFTNEQAQVYSGATGVVLHSLNAYGTATSFGCAVAGLGDLDGDGNAEFVVAANTEGLTATSQGVVRVFSGANASVVYTLQGPAQADRLGTGLTSVGDLDGDGKRELLVGFPGSDVNALDCGGARVYSGATGAVLHSFYGLGAKDGLGLSVAGAGDVNADGYEDLLVGAPQLAAVGSGAKGYAVVYSGATGSVLYQLVGDSYQDGFGSGVAGIGDVDGDGHDDFAVSAPGDDNNGSNSGSVRVFSGASGSAMYTVSGAGSGDIMGAVEGGIDLDFDGRPDVLVGSPGESANSGRVRVLRGFDGQLITTWSDPSSTRFGSRIARAGDTNSDGYPDILVAAASGNGETILISGFDCPISNYCVAAPNSVGSGALMSWTGSRSVAQNNFRLVATGMQPTAPGLFFYGLNPGQVPFGNGYRCLAGQVFRLPVVMAQTGVLSFTLNFLAPPHPAATITGGSHWRFQAWYRDTLGPSFFNLSDGLDVVFCP